jgi:antitoxin component YwqK of YwqJK toxin-antitoxin module
MKVPALLAVLGCLGLFAAGGTLFARAGSPAERTDFWANGQLRERVELEAGRPHGACQRWRADGARAAEGRYRDGRMDGEWSFWHADGTLDAERSGTYRAGVRL